MFRPRRERLPRGRPEIRPAPAPAPADLIFGPPPLLWRIAQPDRPGWWWFRHAAGVGPSVSSVVRTPDGRLCTAFGWTLAVMTAKPGAEWAGPIPEPTGGTGGPGDLRAAAFPLADRDAVAFATATGRPTFEARLLALAYHLGRLAGGGWVAFDSGPLVRWAGVPLANVIGNAVTRLERAGLLAVRRTPVPGSVFGEFTKHVQYTGPRP